MAQHSCEMLCLEMSNIRELSRNVACFCNAYNTRHRANSLLRNELLVLGILLNRNFYSASLFEIIIKVTNANFRSQMGCAGVFSQNVHRRLPTLDVTLSLRTVLSPSGVKRRK